jgi:uncharacterized protein YjiS (DUF1127 family)
MTTIDADEIKTIASDDLNQRAGFTEKLRGLWFAWRTARVAREQRRVEKLVLSRLDAHLLRDMGIDPADAQDAMNGRGPSVLFYPIRHPAKRG